MLARIWWAREDSNFHFSKENEGYGLAGLPIAPTRPNMEEGRRVELPSRRMLWFSGPVAARAAVPSIITR